jgi:hypothetical protein
MWPAALTYALANEKQRTTLNRALEAQKYARTRGRKRRSRSAGGDDVLR